MLSLRSPSLLWVGYFIFSTSRALAWGTLGHQTVGEIAERNLSDKGKALVFQILGPEPLAAAAEFPDLVRPDNYFEFMAPYHYLEVPIGKTAKSAVLQDRNIRTADAFLRNPNFLIDKKMSRDAKMVFLRYFVHIVGDVHQPLHVGNGLDFLAVLCWAKWKDPDNQVVSKESLHHIWDDLIPNYFCSDFYKQRNDDSHYGCTYRNFADTILAEFEALPKAKRDAILKGRSDDRLKWYEEDQALFPLVYPDLDPSLPENKRPYCKQKGADGKTINAAYDESKLPFLDEKYARRSLEIVKTQILKAGFRLAWIINQVAEAGQISPLKKDEKHDIMKYLSPEKY